MKSIFKVRPASELVYCPVIWDGKGAFFIFMQKDQRQDPRTVMLDKMKECGMPTSTFMEGSVVYYNEQDDITVVFSVMGVSFCVEVPRSQYLVVY